MAATKVMNTFELEVKETLSKGLETHGIKAEIEPEETVFGTKRRFWVVSPGFKGYDHADRQDIVWRILEKEFQLKDLVKITMVLTFTPDEMAGNYD